MFAVCGLAGQDSSMCVECCVGTGEGDWRNTPCTWVEVSAGPAELITSRNPAHCLMLVPEDTSSPLQLNFILLIKRSAEVGASAADFSWTPRKLFREMLDIKF